MASLLDPSVVLTTGGLLTLAGGLAIVSATQGETGATLVFGGVLLLISVVGAEVHDPDPDRRGR